MKVKVLGQTLMLVHAQILLGGAVDIRLKAVSKFVPKGNNRAYTYNLWIPRRWPKEERTKPRNC